MSGQWWVSKAFDSIGLINKANCFVMKNCTGLSEFKQFGIFKEKFSKANSNALTLNFQCFLQTV